MSVARNVIIRKMGVRKQKHLSLVGKQSVAAEGVCLRDRSQSKGRTGLSWADSGMRDAGSQQECSILTNINHQMETDLNLEPLNPTCSFSPASSLGTSPTLGDLGGLQASFKGPTLSESCRFSAL